MATFFRDQFEKAKNGITDDMLLLGTLYAGPSANSKLKTLEQLLLIRERTAQLLLRVRNGQLYRFERADPFPMPAFSNLTSIKLGKTINDRCMSELNSALIGKHYLILYEQTNDMIKQLLADPEVIMGNMNPWIIRKLDTMSHDSNFQIRLKPQPTNNTIVLNEGTAAIQQTVVTCPTAITSGVTPINVNTSVAKPNGMPTLTDDEWTEVLRRRRDSKIRPSNAAYNRRNYNPAGSGMNSRPYPQANQRPSVQSNYPTPAHNRQFQHPLVQPSYPMPAPGRQYQMAPLARPQPTQFPQYPPCNGNMYVSNQPFRDPRRRDANYAQVVTRFRSGNY